LRDDVGESQFEFSAYDAPDPDAAIRVGLATLGYAYRPVPEFSAVLRGGYYEGRSWIFSDEIGEQRRYVHGVVAGLSAEYRPAPNVGVRWGLDVLFNAHDYSDVTKLKGDGTTEFFLFTVAVVVGTGHAGQRERYEHREAEDRRIVEARLEKQQQLIERRREALQQAERDRLAAAAQPPAAPASEPAAPSSPPTALPALTAGQPAQLRPDAYVRTRATPDGDAVTTIPRGATVTLKVMLRNATGAWWYVNAPAASGWVRDTDLAPVAP
jgi:hypothetical protein